MKNFYVKDLRPDEMKIIEDHYLVKTADIRDGNQGKKHLYMTLADSTGEIQGIKWSLTSDEISSFVKIKPGMIIGVIGKCKEFRGTVQLIIDTITGKINPEKIDRNDYFKSAPEDSKSMYEFIIGKINSFSDEELKKICLSFYEENKERLIYYPAAMSNHHAEYGGLLYHVKRMMSFGEKACEVYTNLNKDLLLAGVALHDIEKLNELDSDENGVVSDYTLRGKMLGHLVMGAEIISERAKALGVSSEKALMLEHMAISHHYEPDFGSPKKPLFPEAEMLHYLDMVDSKMFDMEDALTNVESGEFSDKVFTLDNRKLYKKRF